MWGPGNSPWRKTWLFHWEGRGGQGKAFLAERLLPLVCKEPWLWSWPWHEGCVPRVSPGPQSRVSGTAQTGSLHGWDRLRRQRPYRSRPDSCPSSPAPGPGPLSRSPTHQGADPREPHVPAGPEKAKASDRTNPLGLQLTDFTHATPMWVTPFQGREAHPGPNPKHHRSESKAANCLKGEAEDVLSSLGPQSPTGDNADEKPSPRPGHITPEPRGLTSGVQFPTVNKGPRARTHDSRERLSKIK